MLYELAIAPVMASPGYLERLNNPTPSTQRIMPTQAHSRRVVGQLSRTVAIARDMVGTFRLPRFEDLLPD